MLAPVRLYDAITAARRRGATRAARPVGAIVDAVITRLRVVGGAVDFAIAAEGTKLTLRRAASVSTAAIGRPQIALFARVHGDQAIATTQAGPRCARAYAVGTGGPIAGGGISSD